MTLPTWVDVANPERIALAGPGGIALRYGDLRRLIDATREQLAASGITPSDTVAVVLRNGPETAAVLLALMSCCRVAPINPSLRQVEMAAALRDLQPACLVTTSAEVEALGAAAECSAPVAIFYPSDDPAPGAFRLSLEIPGRAAQVAALPQADDIALLLHTSGTTAKPKLVPLTHRNLCLSAEGVANALALSAEDRGLCVMPLFHIHGLVAGLLASMARGASVYCAPPFQATSFFSWLRSSGATWYTAVPTIHQAILARAARQPEGQAGRLRLIRSCSSPLYSTLREKLASTFDAPVVNAYGMTEAAHQIAGERFGGSLSSAGTVGLPSGPEVAVLSAAGTLLPAGETGEVVLRGEQIMKGYLSPPGANDSAFHDGWFRTGDQGFLDAEGALTLVGRSKEMINSGGEKISPYEVEKSLLQHPYVAQAVVFAIPHHMLGEAVGAAIQVCEGRQVSERELLQVAGEHLSRHKLPRKFVFVTEIPRGPTGKPQRIGLAERLGLT
jgi:oxalate---CoA ligase